MSKCCGLTRKGTRCEKNGSHTMLIAGVDYNVCHIHSNQHLLHEWDTEITERVENNVTNFTDVPITIMDWLYAFNECHDETDNVDVSVMYATVLRHTRAIILSFDEKFDIFVGTVVSEYPGDGECCVCYDKTDIVKTECGHTLCIGCTKQWMRRSISCPMCRARL